MDEDIMNRFNFSDDQNLEEEELLNKNNFKQVPGLPKKSLISQNNCLGMSCVPHLGQYGDEYKWIHPTMQLRCFPMDSNHKKKMVFQLLPQKFVYFQDNEGSMNQKNDLSNLNKTEFYIINYNASDLCRERLQEYGQKSVQARINIAPHAFLYQKAKPGIDIKEGVIACIYTSVREQPADPDSLQTYQLQTINGINECSHDWGKINFNKSNFLNNQNSMDIHLHPSDQGSMAISPNNFSFLLDMSQPIVSFTLVIYQHQNANRIGVFQINIITNDNQTNIHSQNFINSFQSISYLENISDIAMELSQNKSDSLKNILNSAQEQEAMEKFNNCSIRNQTTQMLRLTYFKSIQQNLLELTKLKVNEILKILKNKQELDKYKSCQDLIKVFQKITNPLDFQAQTLQTAINKNIDVFYMKIWQILSKPNIDNFGEKYANELNQWESLINKEGIEENHISVRRRGLLLRTHMIRLVIKFVQDQLRHPVEILHQQSIMLGINFYQVHVFDDLIDSLLSPISYKNNDEEVKNDQDLRPDFIEYSENPNLQDLQSHLQDIFSQGNNSEAIEQSLNSKLNSKLLVDLICFTVWVRKGRVEGVHPDFGRLSYIQSKKLSSHYHMNDDDRVEMLLELSEKLNTM